MESSEFDNVVGSGHNDYSRSETSGSQTTILRPVSGVARERLADVEIGGGETQRCKPIERLRRGRPELFPNALIPLTIRAAFTP
jgi:hypothetical protein